MSHTDDDQKGVPQSAQRTAVLVENHRAFLRYLERRLGSREAAEDILQDAFVRSVDRLDSLPDEALVPWFYRVLRNALIDHVRRRGASDRALSDYARELEAASVPPADLHAEICACVGRLAAALKPEYAEALHAIDVEDVPVARFAAARGLTAANRRCPGVPRPAGAQARGDGLLRHLRRARVPGLLVPDDPPRAGGVMNRGRLRHAG